MNKSVKIKIGSIVIKIDSEKPSIIHKIVKEHSDFLSDEKAELLVIVKKETKHSPKKRKAEKACYDKDNKVLILNEKGAIAKYFIKKGLIHISLKGKPSGYHSFLHPLSLLFSYYAIIKKKGLIVHATGVLKNKHYTTLFCGPSGSGKSYIARQLKKEPSLQVMNDECIFIEIKKGTAYACSTIFTGKEEMKPKNLSHVLKTIYFLRLSDIYESIERNKMFGFIKLLENSLLGGLAIKNTSLVRDKVFMKNYLKLISEINSKVKIFELIRNKDDSDRKSSSIKSII